MARRTVEVQGTLRGKILTWLFVAALIYWAVSEPATAAAVVRGIAEWIIYAVQGVAHRASAR